MFEITLDSVDRYKYFRDVQIWPLTDEFNFHGWLSNFKGNSDDFKIACRILDFFNYYPKNMVDQMLIASVGHAGYELSKHFLDWKHSDFKKRSIYSFIPGETQNTSDSGYLFTRKLRESLGIDQNQFIDYKDLHDTLENIKTPIPIIFVDDFIGSGSQCYKAWKINRNGNNNRTLEEIHKIYGHIFVYCPLLVNYKGHKIIKDHCPELILSPAHIIGEEYDLFNPNCICWKNEEGLDLYTQGIEMILRKSRELGIPFTNGKCVYDAKGFGEQGLALAFEHGAPDAIPAFFYWCSDNWTPLIKKTYQR